jgi:hypothetical protein
MPDLVYILSACGAAILLTAALLAVWLIYRADRNRIRAEAERQHYRVVSIMRCWIPFYNKTFDWWERRKSRLYRVICRDERRHCRRTYVLIGPRHSLDQLSDVYGDLTWRWESPDLRGGTKGS